VANSFSFSALATTWWLKIYDLGFENDSDSIFYEVKTLSLEFEQNYSRFLDTSSISRLNQEKSITNFPAEFYEMLSFGQKCGIKSLGNFNLAVGGILEDLGYDASYSFASKTNSKSDIYELTQNPFLVLNPDYIQIRPETKLDLGGLGKGWLIDKIASLLLKNEVKYFSINGGGDIYGSSNHGKELEFILENPNDTTQAIGQIQIQNQGLASSSPNRRSWVDKNTGQIENHLINLKESQFDNQKLAVFTSGKNALLADVASTSIFVAEIAEIEIIAKNFEVEFLIIWSDFSFTQSRDYAGILFE